MTNIELRVFGGLIKFRRDIPSDYSEVTGSQFYDYIALTSDKMKYNRFLSRFFRIPSLFIALTGNYLRYKIAEQLEFLGDLKIPADHFFMERIPGTILMSPDAQLADVSFLQFMYIDRVFINYVNTGDKDLLYDLAAGIYKPKETAFSSLDMEENSIRIRKYATDIFCQATLINFLMIRAWLMKVYPFLFPSGDPTETNTGNANAKSNWLDIFDAFVGDNIPNTDYYQDMPCMNAFRLINKRIKEHQKNGKPKL